MRTSLRILIKDSIWKDAANPAPAALYREFENIVFAALMSADIDTLAAVLHGNEYEYFIVKHWRAFDIVEIQAKNHPGRADWTPILKIQED
jgi:hypothetical protein